MNPLLAGEAADTVDRRRVSPRGAPASLSSKDHRVPRRDRGDRKASGDDMMLIGSSRKPSRTTERASRASAETVKKFLALGAEAAVERAPASSGILDADYAAAGAKLVSTAEALGATSF